MKKIKRIKKGVAIVLTLCLVFTMSVPAFATNSANEEYVPTPSKYYGSGDNYNYFVIGDSMTNGFGLEKYSGNNDGFDEPTEGCYPVIFADALSKKLNKKVNLFQYAFTALRTEDVAALLFNDSESGNPNYVKADAFTDLMINYCRVSNFSGEKYSPIDSDNFSINNNNYLQLKKDYQGAAKAADLISVCIGMNTFVCMLEERLSAWTLGENASPSRETPIKYYSGMFGVTAGNGQYDMSDILSGKKLQIYEGAKKSVDAILGKLAGDNSEFIEAVGGDLLYALASFLISYDKLANRLYELNPDATIAFIGFPNGLRNMKATFDVKSIPITIDLELLVDVIFGAVNSYIQYQTLTYKGNAFYVDYKDCDQITTEMASRKVNAKLTPSNEEQNEFTDYVENMYLGGIASNPFKPVCEAAALELKKSLEQNAKGEPQKTLMSSLVTEFNKENIVKGVQYVQATSKEKLAENAKYALVGQVYLGMRAQLINVLKNYENYEKIDIMKSIEYLSDSSKVASGLASSMQKYSTDISSALPTLLENQELSRALTNVFNEDSGLLGLEYFYCKLIMGSGYGAHTNAAGHLTEANRIMSAYEKNQSVQKVKAAIKKAVPLVVGGVTVALISASVAKKLKSNTTIGNNSVYNLLKSSWRTKLLNGII